MLAHLNARTAVPILIALAMFSFHMWVVFSGAPEVYYFRGTHLLFSVSASPSPYASWLDALAKRHGMRSSMRLFGWPSRIAVSVLAR